MARIIKQGALVDDPWQILALNEGDLAETVPLPTGPVIFPFDVWQAQREAVLARDIPFGLWLDSHQGPEEIAVDFGHFALIAINFPKFVDGRGYSTARLLRSRFGWMGELRAIGDVLHDQLFYMKRCGFNSFALKAGKDIDGALATAFTTWQDNYQAAVDQKQPLFRRSAA